MKRMLWRLLGLFVPPITRRIDFPGKGRLRSWVQVPGSGTLEVRLSGATFRLDMHEWMYQGYYFGLFDQLELRIIRRLLVRGGDLVDVGASIGLYTINAAKSLRGAGQVLALEPNPKQRARLEENLELNHCANVIVSGLAAAAEPGRVNLYVPRDGDSAWASLSHDRVRASVWGDGADVLEIEAATLDDIVAQHGVQPAVVKIDVEGLELDVLRGAGELLNRRPALLVEIGEENLQQIRVELGRRGYLIARAGSRRLERWPERPTTSNAFFVQHEQLAQLRRRERRVFTPA